MTTGVPPEGAKKSSRAVTDDIFSKFEQALGESRTLDAEATRKLMEIASAETPPTPAKLEVVFRDDGSRQ